jgi:NADH:ubiquinone oxidoreductase subunit D
MMYNYYRFGGAIADLPPGWISDCQAFVDDFPDRLDEFEAIASKNPIIVDRTVGIGIMDKDLCMKYGVTGPSLRATGCTMDLRKDAPYSVYNELDFDVITEDGCDTYARYLVRMREMRESIKIVKQAIKQIPGGDTASLQAKRDAGDEAVINDPELQTYGKKINLLTYKPPAGEAYTCVESPRGQLGCYIISDGSPKAYRIKWRGASFSNLSALPELMIGRLFPDLMAVFGSLDVILPEVDR